MSDFQIIPKTGRIGRFAKIVKSKTDIDTYFEIMEKSNGYNKFKPEKKALWWNNAVEKLETRLGTKGAIEVMRICGSKCCGKGQRKTAKRLMSESSSIEKFLEKISNYEVKEGELEYKLINNKTINAKYNKCFCGQVKKQTDPFKNLTYCQCSVEFNKQFFEAAFEKPVKVELKQSIINGDDFCEFEIKIVSHKNLKAQSLTN